LKKFYEQPFQFISTHLLSTVVLSFALGIAVGPRFTLVFPTLHLPKILFFTTIFCLVLSLFFHLRRRKYALATLPLTAFTLGIVHIVFSYNLPSSKSHIYNIISSRADAVLVGTMSEMASANGESSKTIIAAEGIRFQNNDDLLATTGKVLVRVQGKWPENVVPGDLLAIRLTLKRPEGYLTPGSFDYPRYLAQKDIWVTGFISSPLFIEKVIRKQRPSAFHQLRYLPERIRTDIARSIESNLSGETSALYKALLLGDRGSISNETLEHFKKSGVLHILAVSGIHIAIAGSLFYLLLYFLLCRSERLLLRYSVHKFASLLTLPFLLGYSLLAGANTPVVRALLMSSIVIAALCTNRIKSRDALISTAILLILLFDPVQLFTVSFQLSFAAVCGILSTGPLLKELSETLNDKFSNSSTTAKCLKWAFSGVIVSIVATLATAPISIVSFNRISIIGIIANLVIEPLLCLWALSFGMVGIIFTLLDFPPADVFYSMGAPGIQFALVAVQYFSSLQFSSIMLPVPPFWSIIIFYLLLTLALHIVKLQFSSRLIFLGILLFSILLFRYLPNPDNTIKEGEARVSFINVGQGTSTLLEGGNGERILIDGGATSYKGASIGERVIAPFLWSKGITTIDSILITHADADHFNGLGFITEHFSPDLIWSKQANVHKINYRKLLANATQKGSKVRYPVAGEVLGQNLKIQCLYAFSDLDPAGENSRTKKSSNNGLVLQACLEDTCVLFPGDIEEAAELLLLKENVSIRSSVMLAAHHGSITSNSKDFLEGVSPVTLIVSAGKNRPQHFPHPTLDAKVKNIGAQLYTTAEKGTIVLELAAKSASIYTHYRPFDNPLYPIQKKMAYLEKTISH